MLKVALTGGIATGKSYVLARLRELGMMTIDADDLVHALSGPGGPVAAAVREQFGEMFLTSDGAVDRPALGAKVFADAEARRRLEALIHPAVYREIEKWFAGLEQGIGIASIPLLYETGHESDFDFVAATCCSREEQLQRIVARGASIEQANQRIAAQMPAAEKAARADFVISTSGTFAETDRQIGELVDRLRRL